MTPGNPLNITIVASGLVDNAVPSLGTFDLNVGFDASILAFDSVVFGNQLDLAGSGSRTLVTPSVETVNISEVSLDSPDDLDNQQLVPCLASSFAVKS